MQDPPRKFTMADLMILVAASAVGFAWSRGVWNESSGLIAAMPYNEWWSKWMLWQQMPGPVLTSLAVGTLICRLRAPRPSIRRLARQPGTNALALVTLLLMIDMAVIGTGLVLKPVLSKIFPNPASAQLEVGGVLTSLASEASATGFMVVASWSFQAISGRWRPERSWIDRMGRFLGFCLFLLGFVVNVSYTIQS